MVRRLPAVVLAAIFSFVVVGCGGDEQTQDGGKTRVVATYSILGNLVEKVGEQNVELTMLVGPNGDAHTFEPAPSDNAALADAAVVFENGLGFETWLNDLYGSSGSEAKRVVVTRGIDPLPITEEGHDHERAGEEEHAEGTGHEHEEDEGHADEHAAEEHGHDHGEFDPHVWHDPANAVVMVQSIRDALVGADPENAEAYEQNAAEYIEVLEALDANVREQVDAIPEENRILFTSHDTFGYFAERYGFRVDTALASVSTEAADPSAGETAELVEEIEASGVPAVFGENVSNPGLMEGIASEAGVELAPPLYTDALGEPGSEGGSYTSMVRYNASTIAEALGA